MYSTNNTIEYYEARKMGKYQTQKGRMFEADIAKYMIVCRVKSKDELRQHTTIGSNNTMLKYMDNPEKMPLGNFMEIMSALKIPKDERLQILERLIEN